MEQASIATYAGINEIVAYRNQAIELYAEGLEKLSAAGLARQKACASQSTYSPIASDQKKVEQFRQETDRYVWSHLLMITKMETLMDAKARREFRDQLEKNPPEVTVETARATIEALFADRDLIFKRGMANAFSSLDRRFKTHDGFKVGSKIIISNMVCSWGGMSDTREASLRDIERTFCILDNKESPEQIQARRNKMTHEERMEDERAWQDAPSRGDIGVSTALQEIRRKAPRSTGYSGTAETEYFTIKIFMNGNAHIWFKRPDLVTKVNKLLGEYYGATLGASHAAAHNTEYRGTSKQARDLGAFMSPPAVVASMLDMAAIYPNRKDIQGKKVIEPSAGEGAIAEAARACGLDVQCYEIQHERAAILRSKGFKVNNCDFLDADLPNFCADYVLMNPPFDRGLDMTHVWKALKLVKPGGVLVAVMSASARYGQKSEAFRERLKAYKHRFQDLPDLSFAPATNVNTVLLKIEVPN